MITSPTHGAPAAADDREADRAADRAEWWERRQAARQHREHSDPQRVAGARRARAVLSWIALGAVVAAAVADPAVRAGAAAFAGVAGLLLIWFFIARTRTLAWQAIAALFATAIAWAVIVTAVQPVSQDWLNTLALLLLPLTVLPIAVPGRVSRFSVSDWLILGATLGLGYKGVEVAARAAAAHLGAPTALAETGCRYLSFALLALTIGVGVATGRHGQRLQGGARGAYQAAGGVVPILGLLAVIGANLPPGPQPLPAPLGAVRAIGSSTIVLVAALAVLILVAYLIDTRRMRATDEPGTDRIPYPYSPADAADNATLAIVGPGNGGEGSQIFHLLTAGLWAACCMVTYLIRDLLMIIGSHLRGPKEPISQALSRGRAAATLTRALRTEAFYPLDGVDGRNRTIARAGGIGGLVVLIAGGAGLARLGDGAPAQWLSAAREQLGAGTSSLGLGGGWAAIALAGLLVLITGVPGVPLDESGARRLLLDTGRGVITFRQFGSLGERLATSTVGELLLDLVTALATLIPAALLRPVVRSAAGGPARAAVAEFCADPARLIGRRRRQLSAAPDDTGAILAVRTGSWDAGSRRRWVDSRITSQAHRITSADGRTSVPATGLTLTPDGVVLLAAVHRHATGAPLLFEGQVPPTLTERLLAPFDDEMRRYATVIRDPHNPVDRLYLVVSSSAAAQLLGGRARDILGADLDLMVFVDQPQAPSQPRPASRVEA